MKFEEWIDSLGKDVLEGFAVVYSGNTVAMISALELKFQAGQRAHWLELHQQMLDLAWNAGRQHHGQRPVGGL